MNALDTKINPNADFFDVDVSQSEMIILDAFDLAAIGGGADIDSAG